ncbi:MAG: PaaI family thioesterase [Tannerellaceae bacterium]|jgi:acyl-CoA thioesterase|nr:PaaI family thioesterase [Tannerellaceae bacterium]
MTTGDFIDGDKFAGNAGIEFLKVTSGGYAKVRMEIKPFHLNSGGVCHGGAIFTLADFAFALAVNSCARLTLSITSSINFFRSESRGFLYAEARETFSSKRISNYEVKITNEEGDLVASFCATGYRKVIDSPIVPF